MSKQVIADLQVLVTDLQSETDALSKALASLQTSITAIQTEIATLKSQMAALIGGQSPPPPITVPPVLTGWGGIFADSPAIDENLDILQSRGYNCFRCMIHNSDFPRTPSTASVVAAVQNAKARNMWIILDYHGYNEPFQDQAGWLSFWRNILSQVSGLYDKIVYEPCNEPVSPDVASLTSAYQAWLAQTRSMGDNHWVIVSVNNYFDGADTNLINQFPLAISDPNTLWSWHEYYFYQYHSSWSISDAQSFADRVALQADKLKAAGKIPFMSEFGADPGSTPLPPDTVASGSAGYAPESLAYVNRLVSQLTVKGAGYMLWTADNWTDTPGAGKTGGLNIWGQLVGQPVTPPPPPPPNVTFRLEAPLGTIIVQNTTLVACQLAVNSLPPLTVWQILDSNNTMFSSGTVSGPNPPGTIDTVFLVAMENRDYSEVLGNGTGTSVAPYLKSLLPIGATIPNYHGAFPGSSEGSYIALIGGDTYGASNGTTNIGSSSIKTLAQLFQAKGVNWQAYREDSNGRGGDHFPWLDFTSIVNDPALMSRVHSGVSGSTFANTMATVGPGFYWFTPNDSHNMHDNTVSSGDSYLSGIIPRILSNPAFTQNRGLLIIWWDEYDPCPNLWIGGKKAFVSQGSYDHYSTLKLIEAIFGLPTLTNNDASASIPDVL